MKERIGFVYLGLGSEAMRMTMRGSTILTFVFVFIECEQWRVYKRVKEAMTEQYLALCLDRILKPVLCNICMEYVSDNITDLTETKWGVIWGKYGVFGGEMRGNHCCG